MPTDHGIFFAFYASEFLVDQRVNLLPLDAQALLVRSWCVCCRDGHLPADPAAAAKAVGVNPRTMRSHWATLLPFFGLSLVAQDGTLSAPIRAELALNSGGTLDEYSTKAVLVSPRLEAERQRQLNRKASASISANARWDKAKEQTFQHANGLLSTDAFAHPNGPLSTDAFGHAYRTEQNRSTLKAPMGLPLGGEVASPMSPAKRKRKGKAVLTYLKNEASEVAFEAIWQSWPASRHEKDGNVVMKVVRGDRLPAEESFQTIIDEGVATPEELRLAAEFYCKRHPKVLEGYVQHVRTFFSLRGGRWAESLKLIRAWKKQQESRQETPTNDQQTVAP